jgi:hypothetical protein
MCKTVLFYACNLGYPHEVDKYFTRPDPKIYSTSNVTNMPTHKNENSRQLQNIFVTSLNGIVARHFTFQQFQAQLTAKYRVHETFERNGNSGPLAIEAAGR